MSPTTKRKTTKDVHNVKYDNQESLKVKEEKEEQGFN